MADCGWASDTLSPPGELVPTREAVALGCPSPAQLAAALTDRCPASDDCVLRVQQGWREVELSQPVREDY